MIDEQPLDEYITELNNLFEFHYQFNDGNNDRAIVISGMAFIDDLLGIMLANFFPKSKVVTKLLRPSGSLGSISDKLDMVYCLGYVNKLIYQDILIAIQIRNLFAHTLQVSFDDEKVKALCLKFKWYKTTVGDSPEPVESKIIFNVAINQIVGFLNGYSKQPLFEKRKLL